MTFLQQSLGQIAREVPGATDVFHAYKLDFCCGGAHTLQEAAQKKGLDPAPIVERLRKLVAQAPEALRQWSEGELPELVAHIQSHFHERHRVQLPELARLARRVEAVHRDHPACPVGLTRLLDQVGAELESHMAREEAVLFPLLSERQYGTAREPISAMMSEHDHHGESPERLLALTNDATPPQGACNTWQALYLGLRTFKEDLMAHIHLENNVLFDQARRAS